MPSREGDLGLQFLPAHPHTPPPLHSSAGSARSTAAGLMIISELQGQVESSWLQAENGSGGGVGHVPNGCVAEKSDWGGLLDCLADYPTWTHFSQGP